MTEFSGNKYPVGGREVEDEGNPIVSQRRLNFVGAGVDAVANLLTGATDITITGGGAGTGEANTTSNSGAGEGLALPKVAIDLPFKSLTATDASVTLTSSATEIDIKVTNPFSASDETKLDAIEALAEVNPTNAETKTALEANADTNTVSDTEKTAVGNLSGTNSGDESAASSSVAGIAELATIAEVDAGSDTTRTITPAGLSGSALQTKVDAIEALAEVNPTGAEIKTAYEGETNAYTDTKNTKLSGIEALAAVNVFSKIDATVAPAVTNDNTEGYEIGSLWIDVTADKAYVCLDITTGTAVWTEITGGGGGGGSDISVGVNQTSGQVISNNTTTALSWDGEDYDTDTMWEGVINPTRITCKTAGKYLITGSIRYTTSPTTGIPSVKLRLNGTTEFVLQEDSTPVVRVGKQVTTIKELAVNDYVELLVYQNNGGSLTTDILYTNLFAQKIDSGG